MSENDTSTGVIERIRQRVRKWLLTPEERRIVNQVYENKSEINHVKSEWSELQRALDRAEIVGEHEIESADILVLTGRQHVVRGAKFGDGIYINGRGHTVTDCYMESDTDR
jgi:hypothetical protein